MISVGTLRPQFEHRILSLSIIGCRDDNGGRELNQMINTKIIPTTGINIEVRIRIITQRTPFFPRFSVSLYNHMARGKPMQIMMIKKTTQHVSISDMDSSKYSEDAPNSPQSISSKGDQKDRAVALGICTTTIQRLKAKK